jgi:hypothetical protein
MYELVKEAQQKRNELSGGKLNNEVVLISAAMMD